MPRRTGKMDGECYYCYKKMWITGFLGGEVVCNKCIKNNKDFLYKQQHFNDALTIQVYWRLHKGIKPQYFELWKGIINSP